MRLNPTKATTIALIAAAGLVPALAPAALAQTPTNDRYMSFPQAQEALEHQIIARQVQLALLGTELANSANVTSSDRSTLSTVITNEQAALATDASNAQAATTFAELSTVRQAVVGDERVYAVVTGQVGLVLSADNDTVIETGYTALVSEITPLVTELGSNWATSLLADVTTEISSATSLTNGVSAEALALTPAGYPGNESEIKTWGFQLRQVSHDLQTVRWDIKNIEQIALNTHHIRGLAPVPATTTTSTPPTTTSSSTSTTSTSTTSTTSTSTTSTTV